MPSATWKHRFNCNSIPYSHKNPTLTIHSLMIKIMDVIIVRSTIIFPDLFLTKYENAKNPISSSPSIT
jgi:hypothetical protein